MNNLKVINKSNLKHIIQSFSNKKICAMVKSNAYGHGIETIVSTINDEVDFFGVVNIQEAKRVRAISEKPILICSKTSDFQTCKDNNFDIMIESAEDLKTCLTLEYTKNLHLKIDCGMNRFGCKNAEELKKINTLLESNHITLKSICTHFSNTENKKITQKQYKKFCDLQSEISQSTSICFGGSGIANYPFKFDILRLGIGLYGYGNGLKPVLKISSYVNKIFYLEKGEFVGYGKFGKIKKSGYFAIVPIGYGDGLRRNLSNKLVVKINKKEYQAVGNICMDCVFVYVDETINVGDEVTIMDNAEIMAKQLKTISYEVLTGFSNARAETILDE